MMTACLDSFLGNLDTKYTAGVTGNEVQATFTTTPDRSSGCGSLELLYVTVPA